MDVKGGFHPTGAPRFRQMPVGTAIGRPRADVVIGPYDVRQGGGIGFPVQGKLSPEVTDELFNQSVRRTRYLSNKEK